MGTSIAKHTRPQHKKDHPHACGDKFKCLSSSICVSGSSPRVWGQDLDSKYYIRHCRIIPTRVGTSTAPHKITEDFWDHPHACGDKIVNLFLPFGLSGSSPRVWGQVRGSIPRYLFKRIIPTRVGTSVLFPVRLGTSEDHPHACGDKTKEIKENSGFAKSTA